MIVLCADDFGLSFGISSGITELGLQGRLSATSALVTLPRWTDDAPQLAALRPTIAVGLHVNLTLGRSLKKLNPAARSATGYLDQAGLFRPVSALIRSALMRRINVNAVAEELAAQISAFRSETGVLPDFVDGHQHVHVLPGIRDALLTAIDAFTWPAQPLLRVPSDAVGNGANTKTWARAAHEPFAKRRLVRWLGHGFRERVGAAGFPTNDTFAGFSAFKAGTDYAAELTEAIKISQPGAKHLIMCHPGHVDAELRCAGDSVSARREEEWQAIAAFEGLPSKIWHAERDAAGCINWDNLRTQART